MLRVRARMVDLYVDGCVAVRQHLFFYRESAERPRQHHLLRLLYILLVANNACGPQYPDVLARVADFQ